MKQIINTLSYKTAAWILISFAATSFVFFRFIETPDLLLWGQYAGYIGGVLGTLFSLSSIFLLLENLKQQRNSTEQQRFESSYFFMIQNLNTMISKVRGTVKVSDRIKSKKGNYEALQFSNYSEHNFEGEEYLSKVLEYLIEYPYYNTYKMSTIEVDTPEINSLKKSGFYIKYQEKFGQDVPLENMIKYSPIYMYEQVYKEHYTQLGHIFRYLYNILKFVIEKRDKKGDAKFYIDLIQAQLSSDILGLIFYNAISKHGKDSNEIYKFHDWLNEYSFFENIYKDSLIYDSDDFYYPKTTFKFKTR